MILPWNSGKEYHEYARNAFREREARFDAALSAYTNVSSQA